MRLSGKIKEITDQSCGALLEKMIKKMMSDGISLRQWVGKVTEEKLKASEKAQSLKFNTRLNELQDMFNVEDLIGPMNCEYINFA